MITFFDTETKLIDASNIIPPPVCLQYKNDTGEFVVIGDDIPTTFLELLKTSDRLVAHQSNFDLSVIWVHYPETREAIWNALDEGKIYDTKIAYRLWKLSTVGSSAPKGAGLASVLSEFSENVDKLKEDKTGIRMTYGALLGVPLSEWSEGHYTYAIMDCVYLEKLYNHLQSVVRPTGVASANTWQLQVKLDFALRLVTHTGIDVDAEATNKYAPPIRDRYFEIRDSLVGLGFAKQNKDCVSVQEKSVREYLSSKYSHLARYTDKGLLRIDKDSLGLYPQDDCLVSSLLDMARYEKLWTSYFSRLVGASKLHPSYDVLKTTGRTCSQADSKFPSINIQQIPKEGFVRECFKARPGGLLIAIDFACLEMCSVANQCVKYLGYSKLADALNSGLDVHTNTASMFLGVPYDQFHVHPDAKKYRNLAKVFNLGLIGGLQAEKLIISAKLDYNIDVSALEAKTYVSIFYTAYPEIKELMDGLKKTTRWGNHNSYIINGRLRAGCSQTEVLNGVMLQSPSADAVNECVYQVVKFSKSRGDAHVVAFIHDELLISAPLDTAQPIAIQYAKLMADILRKSFTHVRSTCEWSLMSNWTKGGPFINKGKVFT